MFLCPFRNQFSIALDTNELPISPTWLGINHSNKKNFIFVLYDTMFSSISFYSEMARDQEFNSGDLQRGLGDCPVWFELYCKNYTEIPFVHFTDILNKKILF